MPPNGQDIRIGSTRSSAQHIRSARASGTRWADPGCPIALAVLRLMSNSYLVGAWAVVTETTDPTQPGVAFRCSSELEAKGTEFYGRTAPLIATKEPPSSTNQPGHRTPPSCRAISLVSSRSTYPACNARPVHTKCQDRTHAPQRAAGLSGAPTGRDSFPVRQAHSFRRSDTQGDCRPIGASRRVETRQGHRQHSDRQDRTEDGICLEPPIEFARIPQIVPPDAVSHDDPSLRPVTSRSSCSPGHASTDCVGANARGKSAGGMI
jgi:hypothetical protein